MPTPTKRTRSDAEGPAASSSSSPSTPSSSSTTTPSPPTPSTPTTRLTAARRQGLTRSASTASRPPTIATRRSTTALTATSSLPHLFPSGGRGNSVSSSSAAAAGRVGLAMGGRTTGSGSVSGAGSGTSMLLRTQSTPSVDTAVSLAGLKDTVSAVAGGSGAGGKPPHGEDGTGGLGGRRFGKGKENIPPKKDEENEEAPRKRMRVTSRGSIRAGSQSSRKRSGSVASVRSETTSSGRHASLAPSSSASSIASWGGRFASPSPSLASSAPSDYFSFPADSFDASADGIDAPKQRITRSTGLPTPPPSSPSVTAAEEPNSQALARETKKAASAYKHLKSFLRLSNATGSSVDELIVGRFEEKASLRAYLADSQAAGQDVGMYVSGPPGTGKTALVTALGGEMGLDGWKVVVLGCMGLKIGDVWKRIGDELGCGKAEKDVHECLGRQETKVLVILDEVDSLMPPPPSTASSATSHLLSKLFSLPLASPTTKLVAISNTLDLTVRAGLVLPDGLQPQVLPFKAYSAAEMTAIVNARVAAAGVDGAADGVKVDPPAISLLGKKVEAQNGDLRMCLGVLGSAVSIAEGEYTKRLTAASLTPPAQPPSSSTDTSASAKPIAYTKVGLSHIMKALTSYTQSLRAAAGSTSSGAASPITRKVRSVQLQGKMVLVAMLVYMLRVRSGLNGCPSAGGTPTATGAGTTTQAEVPSSALYTAYAAILAHSDAPFPPAPESDFRDLLSNLETLGLVRLVPAVGGRHAGVAGKAGLCVREEEVREGLGLVPGQKVGLAEEEVRAVWEREEGRVRRVKEKARRAGGDHEDF